MDMQKALRQFLEACRFDNASEDTLKNYESTGVMFVQWLEREQGVRDTQELSIDHLRAWVMYMRDTPSRHGKKFADSTVHQVALRVQVFCHWLENEEKINPPITTRFKLPKVEQKFIPTFTPGDVERLLVACESSGNKNNPRLSKALASRNKAIVTVLIDTGIRRKELAGLRMCDIDADYYLLNVHRKGNRWQQVPISREAFKVLHEYITKHYRYLLGLAGRRVIRKDDPVFLTEAGKPMSRECVTGIFEVLKRRAGIEDKRVSPHNCRRYMATTQLRMGRNPLEVQRQLGHTTLTMTNRYASLTVDDLRHSHEQYSPLRVKESGKTEKQGSGYWDE
ncbi:MAG: tyrosine-type recombinase/integrase [Ktedonobacteraceae bacterium]|nr:tyrosine-type recombinase/integrase [Ktedonobacteraceae bacterium]